MTFDELISADTRLPQVYAPPRLPLRAFYARDRATEGRRARFYANMAREFEFEGWHLGTSDVATRGANLPGRGGRKRNIEAPNSKTGIIRDLSGDVVGFLTARDVLNDPVPYAATEKAKNAAHAAGEVRRLVARRMRDLNEKAQGNPLSSVDWLKEPSGQGGPRMLSAGRLEALDTLGMIRTNIPPVSMNLLERTLFQDEFTFDLPSRKASEIALEDLRFALDFAAHHLDGYGLTRDRLLRRWKQARDYLILLPAMELARKVRVPTRQCKATRLPR